MNVAIAVAVALFLIGALMAWRASATLNPELAYLSLMPITAGLVAAGLAAFIFVTSHIGASP